MTDEVPTLDLPEAPAWWRQAECRGYGLRFSTLPHDEAIRRFCAACSVRQECLDDLMERARMYTVREIVDGDMVCGGLTPAEQYAYWRARKQRQQESA